MAAPSKKASQAPVAVFTSTMVDCWVGRVLWEFSGVSVSSFTPPAPSGRAPTIGTKRAEERGTGSITGPRSAARPEARAP